VIVVSICGATATGKTDLAFELAKKWKTEIISFDSVQVYKKLDIGTAKPPKEMLAEIPHHFVDAIEPNQIFTAGDFRRQALELLKKLSSKYERVVLVGGTGFYLQALLKGMHEIPPVSEDVKHKLSEEFRKKGSRLLFDELVKLDPQYAAGIHENDSYRIMRGLELIRSGKTPTEIRKTFKGENFPYELRQIGLRRKKEVLKGAITRRTRRMFEEGLVEETKRVAQEYTDQIRPLQSVGYKECLQLIRGEITETQSQELITKNTLALAKRQSTWFRRDPSIGWFDPDEDTVLDKIL
jgi:tRNA dimethylallyltransferase